MPSGGTFEPCFVASSDVRGGVSVSKCPLAAAELSTWHSRRAPYRPLLGHIGGMNIANFLGSRGGPASTADLGRAGFTRYRIGLAVAEGTIVRIRRGHYALPSEASALRYAREARRAADLCLRGAELRVVDVVPTSKLHLCVGHGAAARLRGAWPLPASPAPVASCGRTGRRPDPRAALPAGTGSPRHGPVCGGSRATSAWPSSAANLAATATPGARWCLTWSFPGPTRYWKSSPTPLFAGPGLHVGGMSRSPGWGRRTSLLRTASSWRPTAHRIWSRGR